MTVARPRVSKSKRSSARFPSRFFSRLFGESESSRPVKRTLLGVEQLESRWVMAANPVVHLETNMGNIDLELFADNPAVATTVQNFLDYVNDGSYFDSFFHRSQTTASFDVIQTGGFTTFDTTFADLTQFDLIPTNDPIALQAGISNTRGTLGMARTSALNSATSQFYINVANNPGFDGPTGFAVFGRVVNNTMNTVDAIANLQTRDIRNIDGGEDIDPAIRGAMQNVPFFAATTGGPLEELVTILDVSVTGDGTVTGTAYRDIDKDGVQDAGEDGLPGVTVFVDTNDDGDLDTGETSTTTDVDGNYSLSVPEGAAVIRQLPKNGFITVNPDGHDVDVVFNETTPDVDFGNSADIYASFTVQVTHTDGTPVSAAAPLHVGDEFKVNVFIQDPQPNTSPATSEVQIVGVDLLFNAALANFQTVPTTASNPSGVDLTFGSDYNTLPQVGTSSQGLINEVFTSLDPGSGTSAAVGDGVFLMFSVNMVATAAGALAFSTAQADNAHRVTVFDSSKAGGTYDPSAAEISFGTANVNIVSILAANPDLPSVRVDSQDNELQVLGNDVANPAGTKTITAVDTDTPHGTASISGDNQKIIYTPDAGFSGTDTFTYTLSDGTGAAPVTGTITVNVHDLPAAGPDTFTFNEDSGAHSLTVLGNDEANPGRTNTITAVSTPAHGTVTIVGGTTLSYTPAQNFFGVDTFTYTIADGSGQTDQSTVTVNLTNVADLPTGTADTTTTAEGTVKVIDVLANDFDVDNQPQSNVGLTVTSITQAAHGVVTIIAAGADAGKVSYTPPGDFFGSDSFTYVVKDAQNNNSTPVTVNVTVTNVNDNPTGVADTLTTFKNAPARTFTVLANDTDADNVPASNVGLTVSAITQGTHGTVAISAGGGSITYQPAADYLGPDTFTYTVQDGAGGTATVTVNMTVADFIPSSLAGFIFEDLNHDGIRQAGEPGVVGVPVTLTGNGATAGVNIPTTTGQDGSYSFANLAPGPYDITHPDLPGLIQTVTPGKPGGEAGDDGEIVYDNLAQNSNIEDNNFAQSRRKRITDFFARRNPEYLLVFTDGTAATDAFTRTGGWANIKAVDVTRINNNTQVQVDVTLQDDQVRRITLAATDSRIQIGTASGGLTPIKIIGNLADFTTTAVNRNPTAASDTGATGENTPLAFPAATGVLANDSDPDTGNTLVVSAVNGTAASVGTQITLASGALLTLNANGGYTYDPNGKFESLAQGATTTDSFNYTVSDGNGGTAIATTTITITGVNDAPLVTTTGTALSYTENAAATPVDNGLTVADPDTANLTGATVTITSNYAFGEDLLAFTNQLGITGSFNATTGVLTLTGTTTVGNYQTALRSVTYANSSDAPSTLARTVSFAANDGTATGAAATRNITVTAVSEPPIVTPTGTALAYTENGAATAVDAGVTVTDPDSANLTGATVTISTNYVNGEDVLAFTNQNGITGSFNAATGALTLSGTTTVANYQTALRSITYVNNSNNPSTLTRTVSFIANDGGANSNTATRSITVASVNDAPTVTATATPLAYTENDAAAAVDAGLAVSDPDNINLTGATVSITNFVAGEDALAFANQLGISGTYNAATGVLTLSGTTSVANYQTALRTVAYVNSSNNPSTVTRTVSFVVNDGAADSNIPTRSITVASVNDAPLVTTTNTTLAYTENDAATAIDAGLIVTDADNANLTGATVSISLNYQNGQDLLAFANTAAITGSFSAATGVLTLSGSATVAEYQAALRSITYVNNSDNPSTLARTVSFVATDGAASSVAKTRIIAVTAVNDNPTATLDPFTLSEDSVDNVLNVLANDSSLPDGVETLTITAKGTPNNGGTVTIAGDSLSLIYTPAPGYVGPESFTYTISDGNGGTATATVELTIENVNDNPAAVADSGSTSEDTTLTVPVATGLLFNDTDVDTGDTLAVSEVNGVAANVDTQFALASGALLTVNANGSYTYNPNGQFESLSQGGANGSDSFSYTVSDGNGGTATATVAITITPVNDAPTAQDANLAASEDGVSVTTGVLADDPDSDNNPANLTYSITSPPSQGTAQSNDDGTFTFNPSGAFQSLSQGQVVQIAFDYQALDLHGASSTGTVTVDVTGVNDAPTAADDVDSVFENLTLTGDVLTNDDDVDLLDSLAVSAVNGLAANVNQQITLTSGALLTLNANGGYTYDPNGAFNGLSSGDSGSDSFDYTISDGHGGTSTATMNITINGV